MPENDPKATSFYSMIPESWLLDSGITGAMIRGYSSSVSQKEEMHDHILSGMKALIPFSEGRYFVGFATFPVEEHQNVLTQIVTFDEDKIKLNVDIRLGKIPAGHYVILILPMYGEAEEYAIRRENSIRGLMTLLSGHTAANDLAFEQYILFSNNDAISQTSKIVETHIHPLEWKIFDSECFKLIEGKARNAPQEFIDKINLAFGFISRSTNNVDHTVRFSNSWIALEIVAGGHKGLRTFLNELHPNFGSEAKRFFDMRNALFHHGKRPLFDQKDEQFLNSCVIAIILRDLGYEHPAFTALICEQIDRHKV